jgi:hypothetical protein
MSTKGHLYSTDKAKKINSEVLVERCKQELKWGEQNHEPILWCAILGEEVGEVNKAALEAKFEIINAFRETLSIMEFDEASFREKMNEHYKGLREELIQVAAVAVAFVESLDRNQLKDTAVEMTKELDSNHRLSEIGTASTIGELRDLIKDYSNETSFGFRNQPIQQLVEVDYSGEKFVVFDEFIDKMEGENG